MTARVRRIGWWRLGLAGVASIVFGSGWYQVWFGPPYRYVDEQAHAGYVLEVQAGRMPTIDTPIDATAGGPELRERLSLEVPRRRDVWVANNPPLPYVVAAGPAALSRAAGAPGGPLIGLRLVNLSAMTAAVVVACGLGRRLSGGDARVGLMTGAVTATVPHTGFLAGMGMTDGIALMAVIGTVAAAARSEGVWTRRWWARLAAWVGFGLAVRPMSAVLCGGVLFITLVPRAVAAWRRGTATAHDRPSAAGARGEAEPRPASRTLRVMWTEVVAAILAAVGGAWYVRNIALYGDPTGSEHLFAKFDRPTRSVWDFSPSEAREVLETLFLRRLQNVLDGDPTSWTPVLALVLALGVCGTVVTGLRERRHRRLRYPLFGVRDPAGDATAAPAGAVRLDLVVLLAVASVLNAALVVQHWSGGGGLHPRYGLLLVPVLAAFTATFAARLHTAVLLALFVGPVAALWYQVPRSSDWVNAHKTAPLDSPLTMSIGPEWLRMAGPAITVAGLAVVVGAVIALSAGGAAWRTQPAEG